ncbi:MAG: sensor histidine kinase, partial [Polyangiales bacterium]
MKPQLWPRRTTLAVLGPAWQGTTARARRAATVGEHLFDEMKRYVSFGEAEQRTLRELGPLLEPRLGPVVDEFYARIERHPRALAVISGGPAQVQRLKVTLRAWLATLFAGPWDLAYFEHRALIGRRHVLIQLPQHYNFTAVNLMRNHLIALVFALDAEPEVTSLRVAALDKIIDLELAIILHTYSEDSQTQLQRQERMATFGQMTSAIGHELRNPLGVIESSVFLVRRRVGDDPTVARHLDKIQAQVARSNRIISSMLDIVRERPPRWTRISPERLAERAASALHDAIGVGVQLHVQAGLPEVRVDEAHIEQVLLNLLTNAYEAAGKDGTVRLTVRRRGDAIELVVSDSGPGVDPSVRARIFDPLVTTKHSGVGLGLALCRKLAQANDATLELLDAGEL